MAMAYFKVLYQQYSQEMNETEINIRIADLQAILLTTSPRYSF
jgi:hypothetical protein